MSSGSNPTEAAPSGLQEYFRTRLPTDDRAELRTSVLPALIHAISEVAAVLRASSHVAAVGSSNAFGDDQLNVDVLTENIVRAALARCPSIATASSEEDPEEKLVHAGGREPSRTGELYTVAFDPLDGSSIIAANWSVGTIIGVWDGATAVGQDPTRKQIAAILGVLGPRTTAIVALRVPGSTPSCFEVALAEDGSAELIRTDISFAKPPFKTRYFAPANLRSAGEDERYMELLSTYIRERCSLRYCGGLVPDIAHALSKGHGIYVSPVTAKSGAKLRRLYELYPIALVIECAGGKAIDPATGKDILATPLGNTDERAGLVCGTTEEVELVKKVFEL